MRKKVRLLKPKTRSATSKMLPRGERPAIFPTNRLGGPTETELRHPSRAAPTIESSLKLRTVFLLFPFLGCPRGRRSKLRLLPHLSSQRLQLPQQSQMLTPLRRKRRLRLLRPRRWPCKLPWTRTILFGTTSTAASANRFARTPSVLYIVVVEKLDTHTFAFVCVASLSFLMTAWTCERDGAALPHLLVRNQHADLRMVRGTPCPCISVFMT